LPLELYDARQLSDGRVALVVGEGSNHDEAGNLLANRVVGSIWLVDRWSDGWKIDAVIGGIEIIGTAYIRI